MPARCRSALIVVCCGMGILAADEVQAQNRRPPAGATKPLDLEADKVQEQSLNGLAGLAKKYEDAGDVEKTAAMLKEILRIKPDVEAVKNKLKEVEESIFKNSEKPFKVEASKNWTTTAVTVTKDQPIRIQATGTYKFIVNEDVGPNGFAGAKTIQELVPDLPTGGLIAVVASNDRNKKDEPKPIFVGEGKEVTFKESGLLLLKLNVPSNSNCIGSVMVTISGNYTPVR